MHSFTEFVVYLVMLAIVLVPLLTIGFIIDNKFKILWTIMGAILGFLIWRKTKKPTNDISESANNTNNKLLEKVLKEVEEIKKLKE